MPQVGTLSDWAKTSNNQQIQGEEEARAGREQSYTVVVWQRRDFEQGLLFRRLWLPWRPNF